MKLLSRLYNKFQKNATKDKIIIKFYDENIEQVIIDNIRSSKKEIKLSMAWLTSLELLKVLEEEKTRGIKVYIIIDKNEDNEKKLENIKKSCTEYILAEVYSGRENEYHNVMHNKYCIIDNYKIIDGSYNWTNSANYNDEHIIIIESKEVSKMYGDNFQRLYDKYKK